MRFLSYTKEKAMLAAGLAIAGMIAYWTFSTTVVQALDVRQSPFSPTLFVIFVALCLPLVVGVALINRLGSETIVLNSTILSLSTVLMLAYLYVLACVIASVWNRFKK